MSTQIKRSTITIDSIFDNSSEILSMIIDHEGTIIFSNKKFASRFYLKPENIQAKNYFSDFLDHLNSIEIEKVKSVLQTRKETAITTSIDGQNCKLIITPKLTNKKIEYISIIGLVEESEVELKSSINSLNKQNGDLLDLIEKLSLQNIELSKSNDSLKNELADKDHFFSILAHDLRGQMGNMINSSDLLVESFDNLDSKDLKNIIGMLNRSIRKKYKLLDDLLLWSYFERGKIALKIEQINLNALIEESLKEFNSEIIKKNIVFENKLDNNLKAVCDIKYIKTALQQLISNAIKFSYPDSVIEISYESEDDFMVLIIKDHGTGIDADTFSNLFKIDQIHSNYGTQKETGNGMGLLVAKKIIDSIDGKLKITTQMDKGTIVRIYCKKK